MATAPDHSLLESLFPPQVVPEDEIDGIPPEVGMYKQHFGGRAWPQVKRKYYEWHTDAFSLMDHSTLKFFIGGYLNAILTDPDSNPSESIVYFAGNKSFVEFCGVLADNQTQYLLATVDWIIKDDYFSDDDRIRYARNREIVSNSLNTG